MTTTTNGDKKTFVYAGLAGESAPGRPVMSGLYRMGVGENQWQLLGNGLPEGAAIRAITVHPQRPETVIIGTQFGPYRTDDHGEHWDLPAGGGGTRLLYEWTHECFAAPDSSISSAGDDRRWLDDGFIGYWVRKYRTDNAACRLSFNGKISQLNWCHHALCSTLAGFYSSPALVVR